MRKSSPGCDVIVLIRFVKISGAAWLAVPLSSADICTGVAVALALQIPADVGSGTIGVVAAAGKD